MSTSSCCTQDLWAHGPALFAGLPKSIGLRLVSRVEFGSGAGGDAPTSRENSERKYSVPTLRYLLNPILVVAGFFSAVAIVFNNLFARLRAFFPYFPVQTGDVRVVDGPTRESPLQIQRERLRSSRARATSACCFQQTAKGPAVCLSWQAVLDTQQTRAGRLRDTR